MNIRARWAAVQPDTRLFLGILAVLAPFRLLHTANMRWMSIDGSYYTEVARNVRDGLGHVSNLSLYHSGVDTFPAPTSVYPLWPWLLGLGAKLVDLATLAHWLPLALYFTSLVAAFAFGRRVWPEPVFPRVIPAFHAGHLLVLLLGLQRDYVNFSSLPYTEPLSWTLLLVFFWRLFTTRPSIAWAVEMGVWAALAYFTRSQMIIVAVAVLAALGARVITGPDRGKALLHAIVAGVTIAVPLGAWLAFLRTFVHDASIASLLRFDQNRASETLEPFDVIVDTPTFRDVVVDRLGGIGAGWDILSESSYQVVFFMSHWALPFALPFLIAAGVRFVRRDGLAGVWAALRRPEATGWLIVLLVAFGGILSVQLAHKHFNGEWYFDRRQSLISLLAFYFPLAWMLRLQKPVATVLGVVVLATTVTLGFRNVVDQAWAEGGELRGDDRLGELAAWLDRESEGERLTVALTSGATYRIGWRTRNVGYHWFYEETSYADLKKMTDTLGAKYVVLHDKTTARWRFRRESMGVLDHDFETLPDKPDGYTILARRTEPPPPPPAQKVLLVGIDGATWKVIAPMIERGELPTFQRLVTEGASQTSFDTIDEAAPAAWTSVATGRHPADHGVSDYLHTLPGAPKGPVTSAARKVPALWNLASDAGARVAVLNWWASWPAEPINGTVVTDRANPAAAGWLHGESWTERGVGRSPSMRLTWPAEAADALPAVWLDPAAFPLDELDARGHFTDAQLAEVAAAPFDGSSAYAAVKTFYALDRPWLQLALDQLRTGPAALTMLHLRGADAVQHHAWDTVEPVRYATPPAELERDRGVVQGVYRYVDSFLAELLAAAGPDTTVVVLSDHGAEPSSDSKRARRTGRPGAHTRAAKGVLFVWGPNVRKGARIDRGGPLDIAPTVAWVLGLPIAEDLPGRVLAEAFTIDFRERRGRLEVPTWGARSVPPGELAEAASLPDVAIGEPQGASEDAE